VTNQSTGQVTTHQVSIDVSDDTAADVAAKLDTDGLSATVVGGVLHIDAENGYAFDFRPAVDATPASSSITGDAQVTVSGIYSGQDNQVITCTVTGSGLVGADDDLVLEVRDAAGELIKRVNIGSGYAPPQAVEIGLGLKVSLTAGHLNDGDQFTIRALADSDPTGFLAAVEINTLFTGDSALNIAVKQALLDNPGRLAVSAGADGQDSTNLARMSQALTQPREALDTSNPSQYARSLVTQVGQLVAARRARRQGLQGVIQQLTSRRGEISGVDINEEAAKLLGYERMFQAMSRVISAHNDSLKYLFSVI